MDNAAPEDKRTASSFFCEDASCTAKENFRFWTRGAIAFRFPAAAMVASLANGQGVT